MVLRTWWGTRVGGGEFLRLQALELGLPGDPLTPKVPEAGWALSSLRLDTNEESAWSWRSCC